MTVEPMPGTRGETAAAPALADLPPPARTASELARWALGLLVGLLVLAILFGKRAELTGAVHRLAGADPRFVLLAIGAEALSIGAFADLQWRVLALSGTRAPYRSLLLLTFANDAIANTVPGEPAVSAAYRYRYYRRLGVPAASSGWTIFTIILAQAIGMSSLLLVGVLVSLVTHRGAGGTAAALFGLLVIVAAGAVLVRRDLVLRLAGAVVWASRRVTGHPKADLAERIDGVLARMRAIPLSARSSAGVVVLATSVWVLDWVCLVCSFFAVHAPVPWGGVLLAYGVAMIVGSFPIVPGGIGIVEGSLAVVLVAYGTAKVPALSVALMFRLVNFWLAVGVGWIAVGVIAMRNRRFDRSMEGGPAPDA